MSKTYNVILHILAIIGAILFFTSCNDLEKDKQRAEQEKITEAIEILKKNLHEDGKDYN